MYNGSVSITAHSLVLNEENFIWYALQSVLPHVDKILVWDTGSTDKTVEIIRSINSPKIEFAERGQVDEAGHTALRNEMIAKTTTDWFMILDGDEVWPEGQLKGVLQELPLLPSQKNCVLSKFVLCVGDIYHYSTWGQYKTPWGLKGHYTARFFRKTKGIQWCGVYDRDSLLYNDGSEVVTCENTLTSENHFFHCGVLPRSLRDSEVIVGHRRPVTTYALGVLGHGCKLPYSTSVPEVFLVDPLAMVRKVKPLSLVESWKNLFTEYLPSRL